MWNAAENLRANSGLKSSEYAPPILGLIFLKFADNKYRTLFGLKLDTAYDHIYRQASTGTYLA